MLSDTTLDWFIRRWQRAMSEHEALGYPRVNVLWKMRKQLPQGAAQKGNPETEDDTREVDLFVLALRRLKEKDAEWHRAFMAKYLNLFDGVVDHKPRKLREKAERLGVPKSTLHRRISNARDALKAYIEENWYS